MYFFLLLFTSCQHAGDFDRTQFEDAWWSLKEYDVCFNLHSSGDTLIHDGSIQSVGPWEYQHTGTYYIVNEDLLIDVSPEGECWDISIQPYYRFTACECII